MLFRSHYAWISIVMFQCSFVAEERVAFLDSLTEDNGASTTLFRAGGTATLTYHCNNTIQEVYCTLPNGQREKQSVISISGLHVSRDLRLTPDLPFGDYACYCGGLKVVFKYLYRTCTVTEMTNFMNDDPNKNRCFSVLQPNKSTFLTHELDGAICNETHRVDPASKLNILKYCDGYSSQSVCHSVANVGSGVNAFKRFTDIRVLQPTDCYTAYNEPAPGFSLLFAETNDVSQTCENIYYLNSSLLRIVQFHEYLITSGYIKLCYFAPMTYHNTNFTLIFMPSNKRIMFSSLPEIVHRGHPKWYNVDLTYRLSNMAFAFDKLCVTSVNSKVIVAESCVRIFVESKSVDLELSTSDCGKIEQVTCRISVPEDLHFPFVFSWIYNKRIIHQANFSTSGEIFRAEVKKSGIYTCHLEVPIRDALFFNSIKPAILFQRTKNITIKKECLLDSSLAAEREAQQSDKLRLHLSLAIVCVLVSVILFGIFVCMATRTNICRRKPPSTPNTFDTIVDKSVPKKVTQEDDDQSSDGKTSKSTSKTTDSTKYSEKAPSPKLRLSNKSVQRKKPMHEGDPKSSKSEGKTSRSIFFY